jgi:predicted TPR repeat methyltransferase
VLEPESPSQGALHKRADFFGVDKLAHSHPNRTYYYRKDHDLDKIIEACTRKLMTDPRDLKALVVRGNSFMKKAMFENAIVDLNVALEMDPYDTECLFNRGIAYSKVGRQENAIADLSVVLQADPNHVSAAFTRATCFNTIGQFSEAIEDYNVALQRDYRGVDRDRAADRAAGLGSQRPWLVSSSSSNSFSATGGTPRSRSTSADLVPSASKKPQPQPQPPPLNAPLLSLQTPLRASAPDHPPPLPALQTPLQVQALSDGLAGGGELVSPRSALKTPVPVVRRPAPAPPKNGSSVSSATATITSLQASVGENGGDSSGGASALSSSAVRAADEFYAQGFEMRKQGDFKGE